MKKILVASAALLMTTGLAGIAQAADAEPGVNLKGDARVRAVYRDNFDFGNSDKDGHSYLDSRVRLTVKGTAAGGAYAIGRMTMLSSKLENNDEDDPSTAVDPNTIWVDMAYLGIPFSETFILEGGKYRVTYGNGFFYDDLPVAGLRGIIKTGNVEINPFIEWESEGQASKIKQDKDEDNDSMRYGVHVGIQFNDDWNGGVLVAYQSDDRVQSVLNEDGTLETFSPHKGWLGSLYFSGKAGNFGLDGEFAYNEGNLAGFNQWVDDRHDYGGKGIGTDETDAGFGAYLQPSYTIDALTLALNFGGTNGGFMAAPGFGFVMIGADHPLTVVSPGELGDWLWAGFVASYAISDDLNLTGNIVYATIDNDASVGTDSLENALEVSAVLDYTISKGATFTWYGGVLIPSFEDSTVEDDPAVGTYGKLQVKF